MAVQQHMETAWEQAHRAFPEVYPHHDGQFLGVFTLKEGVTTILPMAPHGRYQVDGRPVLCWFLLLMPQEDFDATLPAQVDYAQALRALKPHVLQTRKEELMMAPLNRDQLSHLAHRLRR